MPRMNINISMIQAAYDVQVDDPIDDPAPVDLCMFCASFWPEYAQVAHPQYDSAQYTCAECGCRLTNLDN